MRNTKGILIILTSILWVCSCSKSNSPASNESVKNETTAKVADSYGTGVANGGGLIVRNNQTLTVHEAGLKFDIHLNSVNYDENDNSSELAAEINIVKDLVDRMALSQANKAKLYSGVVPLLDRKYFIIKEEDLNADLKKKLLDAYLYLLGAQLSPSDKITLAAITVGRETYILPEYFKLKDDKAKAAIIYHESLWVQNPKLSLEVVLNAESEFERFIRSPKANDLLVYDLNLFDSIMAALQDRHLGLYGAFLKDMENGPLSFKIRNPDDSFSIVIKKNSKFLVSELIGLPATDFATGKSGQPGELNTNLIRGYLGDLLRLNPGLRFPKEILKQVDNIIIFANDYFNFKFPKSDFEVDIALTGFYSSHVPRFSLETDFLSKTYGIERDKFLKIRGLKSTAKFDSHLDYIQFFSFEKFEYL